ncbi:MAG TPA: hypothetical protein VEL07_09330 [Planctomycetota bacterium]|nr:hypothetical protein [Planctomycetota bacterium]
MSPADSLTTLRRLRRLRPRGGTSLLVKSLVGILRDEMLPRVRLDPDAANAELVDAALAEAEIRMNRLAQKGSFPIMSKMLIEWAVDVFCSCLIEAMLKRERGSTRLGPLQSLPGAA